LIVDKCSDSLKISVSHFWDEISSLGVNIPLIGGFTVSKNTPPTNPSIALEKILKTIYGELSGVNPVLVLLFDDLQRIISDTGPIKVLSILQNALVELNHKGMNIMFVATGAPNIFSQIQDHLDSAVRIFEPYELKPLSKNEVRNAITIPTQKSGVKISEEAIESIYNISGGIPYYMQVLAHNCFAESTENSIGVDEFYRSFPRSLNLLAQREFKGMYDKSSNEEKKILKLMSENLEDIISYTEIKKGLNSRSEPSSLLKSMEEKNLIIKKSRGKYQLRDKIFKEYLKKT